MKIKMIKDEDFVNYKKPAMFISVPYCDFKCCKEAGIPLSVCQNYEWNSAKTIEFPNEKIIERYMANPITDSVVIAGLEPFDSFPEVLEFIQLFRKASPDDIVIYTGFTEEESADKIEALKQFPNIIVKFGRYFQNHEKHFDEVLGVDLASTNQYAKKIS